MLEVFGPLRPVSVLEHTSTQVLGVTGASYDQHETVFVLYRSHFTSKELKIVDPLSDIRVYAVYSSHISGHAYPATQRIVLLISETSNKQLEKTPTQVFSKHNVDVLIVTTHVVTTALALANRGSV